MSVDLRPYEHTLSFSKNGYDMGIAFGGLNLWDNVHIFFKILKPEHRLKIVDYRVKE